MKLDPLIVCTTFLGAACSRRMKAELLPRKRGWIQAPYQLDVHRRELVLQAMGEACSHRGWKLFAAHVRTNHVHAVVRAGVRPEIVMNCFKSYASRALNRSGFDPPNRKRWTRHGSTRYLWKEEDISAAISYVVHEQGEPMHVLDTSAP